MHIQIAQRLRPFSHTPGTRVLVPGTARCLEVFPALVREYSLKKGEAFLLREVPLSIKGPVRQFTITQDLEKGRVVVWGHAQDGFYRFYAFKDAEGSIAYGQDKGPARLFAQTSSQPTFEWAPSERLSLGSHKKQEWPQLFRQMDLATILPIWLRLGQTLPSGPWTAKSGTAQLLQLLEKAAASGATESVLPLLQQLLMTGFDGLLVPRLTDSDFQGIDLPAINPSESPLALLAKGASLIRGLFFEEQEKGLSLLPLLPPPFHSGRYLGIATQDGSLLNFEWSKKRLRRVEFTPHTDQSRLLYTKGGLKSCRVRTRGDSRGERCSLSAPLPLQPGVQYFFDNFQK